MVPSLTIRLENSRAALEGKSRELSSTFVAAAALALLGFWLVWCGFHTVHKIVAYYTPLPMWDYWRVVENLNDYRSFHLSALWRQHNEHRIVFPELAFALDMTLLHGQMLLPLALSSVSYLGAWMVLSSAFLSEASVPLFARIFAVLISGVVAFFESIAGVLAIPFLLQWTLMQLASAVAIVSASKLRLPHSNKHLGTAIAACIIASYSSGNALLLWPIVIAVALGVGARKRHVLILTGAAVFGIGIYFFGYRFTGGSKAGGFITSPLYAIQYVASYLSMPFGSIKSAGFGVKLGLGLCAATLFLFVIAVATRRLTSHANAVLFGYVCFTFLTALLIAGGRMEAGDPRFTAAHAFRYLSVPQMNWSATVLLLFSVLSGLRAIRKYLPVLAAAIVLVLWTIFPKLSPWMAGVTSFLTTQQLATLSVESGLRDTDLMQAELYPDMGSLEPMLARLKEQRLSIYYKGLNRFLGRPITSLGQIRREEGFPGMVVDAIPVESGFRLRGWADRSGRNIPPVTLLFADESGVIVGFGRQFSAGYPPALASPFIPPSLGWVGFVPRQARTALISAYVQVPGRTVVYPLGQAVELRVFNLAPSQ